MNPALQIARADDSRFKQLVAREWNIELLRTARDVAEYEGRKTRSLEIAYRIDQVRGS